MTLPRLPLLVAVLLSPPALALAGESATSPAKGTSSHAGVTRCALCHSVKGWTDVRFAHERTGYPLVGAHRKAACRACHPGGFDRPVADRCAACHQDAHGQEFGLSCEGCHDERSWRTTFTADAHRRTNFPLSGRHALLPCSECHPGARDRSFARAAVDCASCHAADYQRTASTAIDHAAAGFSMRCQSCHLPWRFSPASYPEHDRCFSISRGPHAGIRCAACHTSVVGIPASGGACMTGNAACSGCHEHSCDRTDRQHREVPGYQCKDRKCFECHRF